MDIVDSGNLKKDVVKLALDMVGIGSDTHAEGEKGVAEYIHEYLQGIGIGSELIEFKPGRFNVSARIGSGEGLMLNGHMDTVPIGDSKLWKYSPYGHIANGRLYGRGASDMKGGLAAILASLNNVDLRHPERSLLLTFVADEEVGSDGSMWLLDNRKELFEGVRYGIISEATDLDIQVSQKGILSFYLNIRGKGAHASAPWLGKNAILDAVKAIKALEIIESKKRISDPLLGRCTINIGRITGGTATNVVPDSCRVGVDVRLPPGENNGEFVGAVRKALGKLGIDHSIEITVDRDPYRVNGRSPLIGFMKSVAKSNLIGGRGYTESKLYNERINMDCVVVGPGVKDAIHKPDEFVPLSNLARSERIFSNVMDRWCNNS